MVGGVNGICFGDEPGSLDGLGKAFFNFCFAHSTCGTAHTTVLFLVRGGEVFIVGVGVTLGASTSVL